jgi:hypothetical protein
MIELVAESVFVVGTAWTIVGACARSFDTGLRSAALALSTDFSDRCTINCEAFARGVGVRIVLGVRASRSEGAVSKSPMHKSLHTAREHSM